MPPSPPANPEQVRAATAALRRFVEAGRASWKRVEAATPGEKPPSSRAKRKPPADPGFVFGNKGETLRRAAAAAGMNPVTLTMAWHAARLYDPGRVAALCRLVEAGRARFGPTHLVRAMAVKDAKKRDALIRRAIRQRWGVTRVGRAALGVNGRARRENVGRRPAVPPDGPELITALAALCDKWLRWCDAAAGREFPDAVAKALGRATAAVGAVKVELAGKTRRVPAGGNLRPGQA